MVGGHSHLNTCDSFKTSNNFKRIIWDYQKHLTYFISNLPIYNSRNFDDFKKYEWKCSATVVSNDNKIIDKAVAQSMERCLRDILFIALLHWNSGGHEGLTV